MHAIYLWLFPSVWIVWCAYWLAAGFAVKPVRRSEGMASRLSHTIPLVVAIVLFNSAKLAGPMLDQRFLPRSATLFWLGAAMLLAGLLFTVAARRYLGGNWSARVTLKQDHTLIRGGPYALVRHPIYTGILLGLAGSAVALGEWRGLVALLLVLVAFLRKIRIEEQFMLAQFGDTYRDYRHQVPALIPWML